MALRKDLVEVYKEEHSTKDKGYNNQDMAVLQEAKQFHLGGYLLSSLVATLSLTVFVLVADSLELQKIEQDPQTNFLLLLLVPFHEALEYVHLLCSSQNM